MGYIKKYEEATTISNIESQIVIAWIDDNITKLNQSLRDNSKIIGKFTITWKYITKMKRKN